MEKFGALELIRLQPLCSAKDVKFGGKDVKAGTYTLYTIPAEKEWTVILNKQTGQWGPCMMKNKT